jgi:hypothetical protein
MRSISYHLNFIKSINPMLSLIFMGLADVYYKYNKFILSHYFYLLGIKIRLNYFNIDDNINK